MSSGPAVPAPIETTPIASAPSATAPSATAPSATAPDTTAPDTTALSEPGAATLVLGAPEISRALTRIAHEILERNKGGSELVLLGIPTRGLPLAVRLAARLAAVEPGLEAADLVGSLDVTMYRDDLRHHPTRTIGATRLPASGIDGKVVVLVDDVLYSGRTIRAALDAISDLGRPRAVQLAALVDRGHRELPIRADYVGKNLPTSHHERVRVLLTETDGEDAVLISDPTTSAPATSTPATDGGAR